MRPFGFPLFVLLTGVLFLRPGDLFEGLEGTRIYELTILACFAALASEVFLQLQPAALVTRPVSACVVALLPAAALSQLGSQGVTEAVDTAWMMFKVLLTYLLLVAAIDTPARLRAYLFWLIAWIFGLTLLALSQYHGIVDFPSLTPHVEPVTNKEEGTVTLVVRICGMGIFANPNDLSRMLVVGIVTGLYFLTTARPRSAGVVWLLPVLLFGYALTLTHSRGGLLALGVSLAVLLQQRLGGVRALIPCGVAVAGLLVVFGGGRQTDLGTSEGTGQLRIQHWSDGLEAMRTSPLFGTGVDTYQEFTGGLGAHNSFVHAYVEMGFVGGTLFFAANFLALWHLAQLRAHRRAFSDHTFEAMRPFVLAILAGYAAGMLSSTRCYDVPTYLLLGLGTAYLRLSQRWVTLPRMRLRPALIVRVVAASVVFLAAIQLYVVTFINWGAGK